jgi:5-(carboxyamino)imidazole ribonucleotide synthase
MFLVDDGAGGLTLLVNEIAPRPHNSGHWTLDGARTDQFAQQIRAVCGVGLGSTAMVAPAAAMVNLLGDRWAQGEPDWATVLAHPDATLHLYGKVEARPGRKMGHLTVLADSVDAAASLALRLRDAATR